jgi:hypothetical protein
MTIDKENPPQHRQQPLSLSNALLPLSIGELGLPVRSMPILMRDPIEHLAFLRSILEQALEIANDDNDDYCFSEDTSSEYADGEEENSRSQNQNQNQ